MEMVVAEELFAGGGEMGALMRNSFGVASLTLDWSQTLLGSPSEWAQSLKTALSIILTSRYPMFIWWGAEYANLYNDAYRPILGASKHPQFLGQSAKECWADIWDVVGPLADSVLTTGQPTWSEDLLLLMDRNGYLEETYFTFSYSPVRDESGGVGGVFCAVTETTGRIIGERRLRTLRELAAKTAEAKTVEEACHIATTTLSINPYDIPFALLYQVEPDGKQARLAGTTGIEAGTVASSEQVDLSQEHEADRWNLATVNRTGKTELVSNLPKRFGVLPKGAWSEEPAEALVIPIAQSGMAQRWGLLVVGISPRRELDDDYQGFFDLIASNIATAIANADAYEAERQRAAALAELDRAKTTFFSNISHEFRTPLTLMLGSVEETLGGNEPLSTHQREQLAAAQRNSLRLLKLVNTLLDFSRIEAGRIQAVYEPTDLATFTRELASVFRSAIERARIQLVVDCPSLPQPIYVDREMWEKIVLNLLSNAFKFTFEGKITVTLRFCTDRVELDVCDTGIGIPENELPRLFERFHRIPGTRGRTYEGSGIGLSLVQELVRLHGGILRVTSVEGQGSCFTVSIPTGFVHLPQNQIGATRTLTSTATQAAAYVEEALRWLPEGAGGEHEQGEKRSTGNDGKEELMDVNSFTSPASPASPASSTRILLVDDNADMRDYVRRLLSRDYEVEAVSDGLVALDAVQRYLPDLVLTDVMMPGLDGLGLLRSLRNDPATQNIPIILLSARAGEESRIEGLEAGANDYLIKPFSARELLARVRTNIELARLRRAAVRSEIALRTSEEQAQLAIKVGRLGTWRYNLHTDLVELDKRMREIWGEPDDAQTIPLPRIMERIHPDDRERVATAIAAALAPGSSGMYEIDYRIVWDDGTQRWVSANGQVQFEGEEEFRQPVGLFGTAIDITARKRAEDKLRRSEQRLQLAQQAGRIGTWEWNLLTNDVSWSDGIWTLLGVEPGSITPNFESFIKFLHPDEKELILQQLEIALARGDDYYDEFRVIRQDGSICWLLSKGKVIRTQDGQPERLLGINVDITDRKLAEVALQSSAERLNLALAAAKLGDWSWDAQTDLVTFSERAAEIFGIPPGPYMTWTQMQNLLHEADREQARLQVEIAIAQRSDYDIEYRVIHADGTQRWVAAKGRAQFDATGQVLGMLGVVQDITDRKLAEAEVQRREREFRAVVENTPDLIVRYDRSLRHLYVNPSLERALGIPAEQFIGKTGIELGFTGATLQAWNAVLQQVLASTQDSTFEFEFPNHEGEMRSYQAYVVPELVQDGEVKTVLAVVRDVTEYKRTQEELRQSEERYRLALQAGRMVAWAWDAKTDKIIYAQTACEVIGLRREALQGTGSQGWQLVHPEDLAQHQATVKAAIDSKGSYISEFRIIRPDNGRVIWLEDRGKVNVDAMGHLISIEGTLFDISDRKQAQLELQQTFQTLSTLIHASPLAIVVIKPNMTVQLWNPAAEQLFGWSAAEVLGQPIPIVPEEKRDECRQVREAVAKGEVFAGVDTCRCKRDGAMVRVSISAAPLYNEQGNLNAILLIFQDITQRQQAEQALRQSEERYRYLAESIPQLVWTANAEGVLLDVNQRWLDYTGLTLVQAQIGGWQAIVHPDDVLILSQNWAIAQQNDTYYQAEGRMRRVDGVYRWYLHQAVPLKNERGQVIKWFGTATDIDDQKQLEQQRDRLLQREQAAREEAERANRIKDEFLAVLSHELRSPLNPILGWAKLLQSRTLDEQKTKHALATIERNALLQTQLIEDLLDVSRILRGKLVLNTAPVSLANTIEAALETVRLAADAKGIQIQRVLNPNVGQIMGESARLQQVIWNLLSNAVKFTPSGGTIEIRLEQINTYAQLQVKDTGKGINPEFLPYVFEYFRQEDGTTTRKFGGLGLGLAIVRHLVELHGGTVRAQSPGEGLGATFTISLPLMLLPTETPQDNAPAATIAHLTGLRILVVDDQPDIRDIVVFILEQAGATVRMAACAPEALNLMEQSLPDVLICDIGMPDMDGYMLMRFLRRLPPEQGGRIPAIALTAYAGEADQKQALAAGFQQHIAKPVEPDELVRAVARLVEYP